MRFDQIPLKYIFYVYTSLLAGIVLLSIFLLKLPGDALKIHFLDIGQGDSVLIQTPSFHEILIDGGPGNAVLSQLSEVLPFFEKTIDLVVLTHPHADHLMGLLPVIQRYRVKNVLLTGVSYPSEIYDEFLREVREQGITLYFAKADEDFLIGKTVFFDVLYPFTPLLGQKFDNVNNSSIVLRVEYQGISENFRAFFPGDVEKEVEKKLLENGIEMTADLLKAGHHGSRTSSTEAFLSAVSPQYMAIQSGEGNQFGHPHRETLISASRRGISVFRNDLFGRITFAIGEKGEVEIVTER
ncbi:MBL fold metallo-hydrolase [Candidatus Peregrinibacteria bacterium]|nr:MBL fold metallo-hydrolase [Candidatus Peregrinibacteria bacterium]